MLKKIASKMMGRKPKLSIPFDLLLIFSGFGGIYYATTHPCTLPYVALFLVSMITIICGGIKLKNFLDNYSSEHYDIWELISHKILKKEYESKNQDYTVHFGKILTEQEMSDNRLMALFYHSLFALSLDTLRYTEVSERKAFLFTYFYFDSFYINQKKEQLLDFYKKHAYFRKQNILAKTLIYACSNDEHAYSAFSFLFKAHGEVFTQKEITYLVKHLTVIEDVRLISEIHIFNMMPFVLQERILLLISDKHLKSGLYDELVSIHRNHQSYQALSLEPDSQKEEKINYHLKEKIEIKLKVQLSLIDAFKEQFCLLFAHEKDLLTRIEALFNMKEKMNQFLIQYDKKGNYVEYQLFLDNECTRLLESFKEEVNILSKMHFINHPEVEQRKKSTLESMKQRIGLIDSKMIEMNEALCHQIDEELHMQVSVNQHVLQAKM